MSTDLSNTEWLTAIAVAVRQIHGADDGLLHRWPAEKWKAVERKAVARLANPSADLTAIAMNGVAYMRAVFGDECHSVVFEGIQERGERARLAWKCYFVELTLAIMLELLPYQLAALPEAEADAILARLGQIQS